jgi:dimethylaniline monooxygenase (N-oxide forming)
VCVIGAGCSGLASIKALREVGHDPVAFDLGSGVGGLWVQDSDSGRSAAYDSLRINTSRKQMQFKDHPMPAEYGDYATHRQVAAYFRSYAERFELARRVRFRTEVRRATPTAHGYLVETVDLDSGESQREHFDALVVATGHHFDPAFPSPMPPGHFSGVVLHSHAYRNPDRPAALRGKRVVVVGFGNSAVDIASELAQAGGPGKVLLSTRRGGWVLPRYLLGRPIDQGRLLPLFLPPRLRRRIATWAFRRLRGSMSDFDLPEPDHLIGEAHPTLSDALPELARRGDLAVRPAIARFDGRSVHFEDGQRTDADAIVFCTGYRVTFPFFAEDHIAPRENALPLFRRVFHPVHRRVFFVGLAQPLGAIMPIAELQARWIAAHLAGEYNLPSQRELARDVTSEEDELRARYVTSPRHTMQIDPAEYTRALDMEWRAGRRRARNGGGQAFAGSPPEEHAQD